LRTNAKGRCSRNIPGDNSCPTATARTFLELDSPEAGVLEKRCLGANGKPHGDHTGQWRELSAKETLGYYNSRQPRAWFKKKGFREPLLRERDAEEQQAKKDWKKGLRMNQKEEPIPTIPDKVLRDWDDKGHIGKGGQAHTFKMKRKSDGMVAALKVSIKSVCLEAKKHLPITVELPHPFGITDLRSQLAQGQVVLVRCVCGTDPPTPFTLTVLTGNNPNTARGLIPIAVHLVVHHPRLALPLLIGVAESEFVYWDRLGGLHMKSIKSEDESRIGSEREGTVNNIADWVRAQLINPKFWEN